MNVKEIMEKEAEIMQTEEPKEYLTKVLLLEDEIHARRQILIRYKTRLIHELGQNISSADYKTVEEYNGLFAHMDRLIGLEANLYGAHKETPHNAYF